MTQLRRSLSHHDVRVCAPKTGFPSSSDIHKWTAGTD